MEEVDDVIKDGVKVHLGPSYPCGGDAGPTAARGQARENACYRGTIDGVERKEEGAGRPGGRADRYAEDSSADRGNSANTARRAGCLGKVSRRERRQTLSPGLWRVWRVWRHER